MITVSLDFDGTMHPYSKRWVGPLPDDEPPTEGLPEFLERGVNGGIRFVVSSCRAETRAGCEGIWRWLEYHDLAQYIAEVTATKPIAEAYVDDRAVVYDGRPDSWSMIWDRVHELAGERA